jgi:hypothetical protein
MQLERKLSNSKLGDVDVSTSSLMLPGEKTMVWSDLFSYLSRPEMLQGVSPRQFKESDNQVNELPGPLPPCLLRHVLLPAVVVVC